MRRAAQIVDSPDRAVFAGGFHRGHDPRRQTFEERTAVREVAIDGRLRHAGPLGDLPSGDLVGEQLRQQGRQHVENLVASALGLPFAQG